MPGEKRNPIIVPKSEIHKYRALTLEEMERLRKSKEEAGVPTPEVLEALSEVFGGETLDEITMPKPEELTDEYFDKMYPETPREEDGARGLISYHPDWWNKEADKSVIGPSEETWGQAYIRSMKAEAGQFRNKLFLSESIQKPNYKGGRQQYGAKEGGDDSKDPLLPLIREVFGEKANRFNLTWDQINNELLPKFKSKLEEIFNSKGIPMPKFDVILTPALASNIQMTTQRPENSQTNTTEWTSTPLFKQDNTDSGRRLIVGRSAYGGAGYVIYDPRGRHVDDLGFRLSVVFDK